MKNLKSFFVFLGRNKLYTFINVFGLSVSLLFVILIANYTIGELSTDRFQKNAHRIFAVSDGERYGDAHHLIYRLESRYPEIEKSCGVSHYGFITAKVANRNVNISSYFVDSTFFDLFSFELVHGDRTQVLKSENSVVISESFAHKVFGDINPLGQVIILTDSVSVVVDGVAKDFKNTMFLDFDIMLPFPIIRYFNDSMFDEQLSNAGSTVVFMQTYEGADLVSKSADMLEYFKTFYWIYKEGVSDKVQVVSMEDMYFSGMYTGGDHLRFGNKEFITILLSVGLLILLFAVTNYINLTVAQTSFRAKEMATRRLLGSSRGAIFSKMICESLLICGTAFVIGLFLAFAFEPYANNLLQANISVFGDMTSLWAFAYLAFVVLIGVISGMIPAVIISKFKPIDVVKGTFKHKSKLVYSKVFIVFQNVITIVLIASALTMYLQIRYLINADLGYNRHAIIHIETWGANLAEQAKSFRNELRKLPCVEEVAFVQGTPLDGGNNFTMKYNDAMISFQCFTLDSAAFKMLGLQIVRDNKLTENGWWFNETAMRMMGIPMDTTEVYVGYSNRKISGVIRDFQLRDITQKSGACYIQFDEDMYPWNILVKVNGDLVSSYKAVGELHRQFSDGLEFNGNYIDHEIQGIYESERTTSTIVLFFAFVAILISALGLLAMATYFIQQRSMEIAVRKVFGSTSGEMLKRLMSDFLVLVVVAFVIAIPIIWYAMSLMLQWYRTTIPLSPLLFITAGLFTLLIAFVTIYRQSKRAADSNPVQSIKN